MYDILKKLLPAAEEIGNVLAVHQDIRDRKYYTSDEIRIAGMLPDGRKFTLELEVKDKVEEDAS